MNQNHTDITIILDRSGSMDAVASDTIGGFNRFLDDQQKAPGTASITLHQFDHEFETPIKAIDVRRAHPLTGKTFVPRGSTALLDAIGRGIIDTGNRMEDTPERGRAGKVVFVIITDGLENASHEFDRARVFDMIQHQREKYAWEFVFLGANQDAIKTGAGLGVSVGTSMSYAHTPAGVVNAFAATSENLVKMRSGGAQTMDYSAQQRTDAEGE